EPQVLAHTLCENPRRGGRRPRPGATPRGAADGLRRALALFRGPPLDDVAFFPFAQAELGRLAEMRLAGLEDRIDADLAACRSSELVGELEALVKEYPLRERLHGQLMLALYRAGRQADGLDAYRKARQYLADELGIEPGSALRQLEQAILVQDPSLEVSPNRQPIAVEVPPQVDPSAGATPVAPIWSALRGWERRSGDNGEVRQPPPAIRRRGLAAVLRRGLASVPRRLVILLAALVILASLAVGVTTAVHGHPPSLAAVRGDAIRIIDPGTGAVAGTVPLEASAGRIATGAGSVWVTNFGNDT